MRMPPYLTRPAALAAVLATAVLMSAAPAAQADGDDGWQPYHGQDYDAPAGTLCPFHLHITDLLDQEETKTVARYPDGSPEKVLWRGPLILRYTNVDTGAQVDRDQSGRATEYRLPDGSTLWDVPRSSHISAKVHPGNPYHAVGDYVFSGGAVLLVHSDQQVEVLVQHQVENLCQTLA
ncbi:hypothetical protein BX285_3948 [Streptomyces sp. 1114.5]|uniref:hypothetical protein n=1 Tax=unclassified Streptomyces TaxID=2593676 RepID=UPI000BC8601E|nr:MULTISPECIES: hypothetical protein [unclassified Streptomyces]RKT19490.1 hypothetical protein BX285_3948 [Streptomyces sp. 1114.5]SOB85686.1 hypothetical protein SAMN06272789_5977 [Streptomyces sp. 1331.2]